MMKWRMTPALVLSLLALPAAALAQDEMVAEEVSIDAIRAEIEAAQTEWEAAFNGEDPASTAGFYTDDAVLMPPNMPAVEGIDAIREFFAQGMGGATIDVEFSEVLAVDGGTIVETGGYEITGADGSHLDHGKYVAIAIRTDDGLKLTHDIWNSSMAPREMDHAEMREKMHGDEGHDEAHQMKEHGDMEKAADDAMDAADMDDDGDGVPTMDEDDEM